MEIEEFEATSERRWRNAEHVAARALGAANRLLPKGSDEARVALAAIILREVSTDSLLDGLSGIQTAIEM